MTAPATHTCRKCGQDKPVGEFTWRAARNAPNSYCRPCVRDMSRERRAANPAASTAYQREWRKRNPDSVRSAKMRYRYGISLKQYRALLRAQGGVCAICGAKPSKDRALVIDHCHQHGHVRGLLCDLCNVGIGALRDDAQILESAARYILSTAAPED